MNRFYPRCQFHGGRLERTGLLAFCGAPSIAGSSYCSLHRARVWVATSARVSERVEV